jgi:DNA-binding NarL/FixJ family response regulator
MEPTAPREKLTLREMQVLRLLAHGQTARQAGTILKITHRTVSAHTHRIVEKLGAANTTNAVAIAVLDGMITV